MSPRSARLNMNPNPQPNRNKTFQTGGRFIGEARFSDVCEKEDWEEFGSEMYKQWNIVNTSKVKIKEQDIRSVCI